MRWHFLRMLLEGRISLREANDRKENSCRHTKRLKRIIARDGPVRLVHGNTARRSANAVDLELRQKAVELSRTEYASFNVTLSTQKLSTVEGIRINREAVRKIRRQAGILPKRRGRPRRYPSRRVRRRQEGMIVLWEGSVHRWFRRKNIPFFLIHPLTQGRDGKKPFNSSFHVISYARFSR